MNRWLRGALALGAGFTSAVVAIRIADGSSVPPVSPGTKLGDLRPLEYCIATYGDRSTAVQVSDDAYGWRCWVTVNGLVTTREIDFSKACEALFTAPAYAESYNVDWPYSWQCFHGPKTT